MQDRVDERPVAGAIDHIRGRSDPFRHGDLPQRPNYLPEEGEVGNSDLWAIVKGVVVMLLFIGAIGWLLSS